MVKRILSGLIGGGIYIGLGLAGGIPLTLGLGALLILGNLEFWRLCRSSALRMRVEVPAALGLGLLIAVTAATIDAASLSEVREAEPVLAVALSALFLAAAASELWRGQTRGALTATALAVFAGVYISFPLAYMILLRAMPGADGSYYFFLLTVVVWANDTAAYFFGAALGRHRLAPAISPHKTIEGSVAGLLTAMTLGAIFAALSARNPWAAGGVALCLGLLGQAGDLLESLIKRDLGTKDSGTFLPGHGGVLDRFDSMILAAPAAYYLASWLHF